MQVREVRTWTTEELQRRLGEAQRELFTLRRELAMGRLEDHTRIRAVKRDVAQIKTVLRERELVAGGARRQHSE
ncbi:MAG TPA: 50S ribosomal protein L29 [Anaerolineae bacterium]|jgi:large subunit ribosomal protein L29|nr:50S ribosomal protein L29 [Anaerolineae bacterium]